MRRTSLILAVVLAACGGHDLEPGTEPSTSPTASAPTPSGDLPVDVTPTGARPLGPDEQRLPGTAGTGGGPGSPSVSGVARTAQTLLQRCWVEEVRGGDVHTGFRGSLHLAAGPDGSVTSATATLHAISGDDDPSDDLVTCVEGTGRGLQFPPGTSANTYEIPINFDAPG